MKLQTDSNIHYGLQMTVEESLQFSGYLYLNGRYEKAAEVLLDLLRRGTTDPRVPFNLAILKSIQGKFDECTRYCEMSLSFDPGYTDASDLLGHQRLREGHWKEGLELFESRFNKANAIPIFRLPFPLWDGTTVPKSRLLVWCEQGMGDTVQFSRFLPLLRERGIKVDLIAHDPLVHLFEESDIAENVFPLSQVAQTVVGPDGAMFTVPSESFLAGSNYDFHIPIMSLARAIGARPTLLPGKVPFIRVSPARTDEARRHLSSICVEGAPRVGLVWAGSSSLHPEYQKTEKRRSIDPMSLAPLLAIPNISFLSFQHGFDSIGRFDLTGVQTARITDSFADTAALLTQVDLLITVDSSMCHVAGALGVPVWLLNRYDTCWRWFRDRSDSPWYPSMRVFRQPSPGDWKSVVDEVSRELSRRFSS